MSEDGPLPPGCPTLAVRRCALQSLYQLDAAKSDEPALVGLLADNGERDPAPAEAIEQGIALAQLAWEFRHDADREIAGLAREWPPHRQPLVDRNLLRMGWYELRQTQEPPRKVLSDAVELAKEFGTADSGKFVNGVLDKVLHGAGSAGTGPGAAAAGAAEGA